MRETSEWEEAIDAILQGHRQKRKGVLKREILALMAKQPNDSGHMIADILGICLETKRPGEFPSGDALMLRDKIVLKYLVT